MLNQVRVIKRDFFLLYPYTYPNIGILLVVESKIELKPNDG